MKKLSFLLFLTSSVTLPLLGLAQTQGVAEGKAVGSKIVTQNPLARTPSRHQVIYYITTAPHTGSQIPMVYRRYDNRLDSASNAASYGTQAIEATGLIDVGGALNRLDPSFAIHRR